MQLSVTRFDAAKVHQNGYLVTDIQAFGLVLNDIVKSASDSGLAPDAKLWDVVAASQYTMIDLTAQNPELQANNGVQFSYVVKSGPNQFHCDVALEPQSDASFEDSVFEWNEQGVTGAFKAVILQCNDYNTRNDRAYEVDPDTSRVTLYMLDKLQHVASQYNTLDELNSFVASN